jgi:AraC-like DNA-binding protein
MKELQKEIVPIVDEDLFIVLNHPNAEFNYPVHYHAEYEINLVIGTSGERIVGDSLTTFTDLDLAMIGPNVGHAWRGHEVQGNHVITIQFADTLVNMPIMHKRLFRPIKQLLSDAKRGICFPRPVQESLKEKILQLTSMHGFQTVLLFFSILYEMATSERYAIVSSHYDTSGTLQTTKSLRIAKVCDYLEENFKENISLNEVASLLGMSESAFSHFFKSKTGMTFTEHLNDMRIARACQLLSETDDTIAEICFNSGFNNLSNFIRMFKKRKGMTPNSYRDYIDRMLIKY